MFLFIKSIHSETKCRRFVYTFVSITLLVAATAVSMAVGGLFTRILEKDYFVDFSYPVNDTIGEFISQIKAGAQPRREPINALNYTYIKSCQHKCAENSRPILVILVKSAMHNFKKRQAIRETWGKAHHVESEDIFSVFLLGRSEDERLQTKIDKEDELNHDIVQVDFMDSYYNLTLKTMSGLRWVNDFCQNARYTLFVDDDMYISVKNLLTFISNPSANSPREQNLKRTNNSLASIVQHLKNNTSLDDYLYAGIQYLFTVFLIINKVSTGYLMDHAKPIRSWLHKWYISLNEYPYHLWPPYATGMAYVLSRQALVDIYYTSLYTKYLQLEDVFVGIAARKAGVKPIHSDEFYVWKKYYNFDAYRHVIACHGYDEPDEMRRVWTKQKDAGYA